MKNKILCFLTLTIFSIGGYAQASTAPTWSSDVACIVYSHCSSCHNPTSIAPFSLLTYNDALQNMVSIKHYVSNKLMPPYLPNTNYQHYTDMRNLSDQEINTIVAWVNAGGPLGDTTQLTLTQPVFTSSGPVITNPDVTGIIRPFQVPSSGTDLYQCFVITNGQSADRYIKTLEVIPGNRNAVHHVLVFEDTAYSLVARDSANNWQGYPNAGGTGSATSTLIGAWVPGAGVDSLPSGMGIKFGRGSRLIIQIHYPVTAAGMVDSTRVNLQFTPTNSVRAVAVAPILSYWSSMTDGPLVIPADSTKTFHEEYTMPAVNVTLLTVAPHAHLVCTQMKSFAVSPANDTIPFIDIDRWDFHWQGAHSFQRPIKVPASSKIYGTATYVNNTIGNPSVPLPIATVTAGERTADEMMLFYFWYLPYQPGDENIIVDTASHEAHYQGCTSTWKSSASGIVQTDMPGAIMVYPNPTQNILNYQGDININEVTITDIAGKVVKQLFTSGSEGQIPVGDLGLGLYFIRLQNEKGISQTLRFTKD